MKDVFLSEREFEVFNLLLEGKTSKEIAGVLHISPKTVENYVEKLFRKFDVYKRKEIAIKYYQENITVKMEFDKPTKRQQIEKLLSTFRNCEIVKLVDCSTAYVKEVRAINKQLR